MRQENYFIYIIADGRFLKIGQSNKPQQRLDSLQTGCPRKLVLRATFEVQKQCVSTIETEAHKTLHQYRVRGEWFKCSYRAAQKAVESAIEKYGSTDTPETQATLPVNMSPERFGASIRAENTAKGMIAWCKAGKPGDFKDFLYVSAPTTRRFRVLG